MDEWRSDFTEAMRAYHKERFDSFKRLYEAGNIGAPLSAVSHSFRYDVPPPKWVLIPLYTQFVDSLIGKNRRKRGRAGNMYARFRQDMIHAVRADTVEYVRRIQGESNENLKRFRVLVAEDSSPKTMEMLRDLEEKAGWLGKSWPMAFRRAAALLKGTDSYGSPDTIKASYLRVKKADLDPVKAKRYAVPEPSVLEHLNLKKVVESPQGTKFLELMRSEI